MLESMYPGSSGIKNALFGTLESLVRNMLSRKRGRLTEKVAMAYSLSYLKEWICLNSKNFK
jgi:hypothetical protein